LGRYGPGLSGGIPASVRLPPSWGAALPLENTGIDERYKLGCTLDQCNE